MPAISFNPEFLDALLSGRKQQTPRPIPPVPPKVLPKRPLFKVGDVAHIYNQQRRRIVDKPLRLLTATGLQMFRDGYPFVKTDRYTEGHHAHFLGKVEIGYVSVILPCRMQDYALAAWAYRDGFMNFVDADVWFTDHYDECWIDRKWAVVGWDGWLERYFEPEV